jgi:hypothetical protein
MRQQQQQSDADYSSALNEVADASGMRYWHLYVSCCCQAQQQQQQQ